MDKGYRIAAFSLSVSLLFLLSGCDFLRQLAGRPTSEDIAAKRVQIAEEERQKEEAAKAEQARLDSIRIAEQAVADSLALMEKVQKSSNRFYPLSHLRRAKAEDVPYRYSIVVGAFSVPKNAKRFAREYEAVGYDAITIPYGNNYTAVAVCGTDHLAQIWESLQKIKQESFCPKGIWVLVNE